MLNGRARLWKLRTYAQQSPLLSTRKKSAWVSISYQIKQVMLLRVPVSILLVSYKRHRNAQCRRLDDLLQRCHGRNNRLSYCLALSVKRTKTQDSWLRRLRKWIRVTMHLLRLLTLTSPLIISAPIVYILSGVVPSVEKWWWNYAQRAAEYSSPTVMKFLQWASTRRDMFSSTFCDRFELFHENAPTHTWQESKEVLRVALGKNWNDTIDIDHVPIGSGCIAQVHKGRLLATGEEVAVKIVHPNVKELIALDLDLMRALVWFVDCVPRLRLLSFKESIDEFGTLMNHQLNLRIEGENLVRFGRHFRNRKGLRFPTPYLEYTSEAVLVESFEKGVHLRDLDEELNDSNRQIFARIVLDSYLRMVFLDNFAHGDMHPGNLLFDIAQSNGQTSSVVAIDAGIVTRLEPEDLRNFVELFHAVATGNGYKAGELIVLRSPRSNAQKCTDLESFCYGMEKIVSNALSLKFTLQRVHVGELLREVMELCCSHNVKLQGQFASIVISIAVLEGAGRKLDPNLDVLGVARPIIAQSLIRNAWN